MQSINGGLAPWFEESSTAQVIVRSNRELLPEKNSRNLWFVSSTLQEAKSWYGESCYLAAKGVGFGGVVESRRE